MINPEKLDDMEGKHLVMAIKLQSIIEQSNTSEIFQSLQMHAFN